MDADGALALLREILAGVHRLPDAACIGHHDLYDELPPARTSTATSPRSRGLRGLPSTARVPGIAVEPTWGNALTDRRETAGHRPFSARSTVVGKSNIGRSRGPIQL
jgi:hypothetical protein